MPKKDNKVTQILSSIRKVSERPMKIRELAHKIGVKENQYAEFRRIVKKLLDEGQLVRLKKNRIGLPDAMDLVTGVISITKGGLGFCACDNSDEEIYIAPNETLTAFNGDRVMVRLKAEYGFKGKRTGLVIKIIERRTQKIVGTFYKSRGISYLVPDSKSINRNISIAKDKTIDALTGEKVVLELLEWEQPYLNPEGVVLERLGYPDEPGVDMLAIIREYDLPLEFPDDVVVQANATAANWRDEIKNRTDLTHLTVFTIDPADARDHDDAVSIETENGKYRLGVHIADVSHFVQEGTKLDKEAFSRATSVYFPDRVISMLPEVLSNDACSLRPNRIRLAYSIFIDFDKTGKVMGYELYPSTIKSRAKLSYDEVQEYYEYQKISDRVERVTEELSTMRKLARILYKRRQKMGSLDFDLPEAKIVLDKQGNVIELGNRVRWESHRLVEEFMLAANRQVAYHFLHNAQPILYRVHDRPDIEKLEAFSGFIARLNYNFPVSPNMPSVDFTRLLKKAKGKPEEILINELLVRSMAKAVYQPKNIGHFGLAYKHYLHFTSPIRRYPDLLVHRLLKQLKNNKYPVKLSQKLGSVLSHAGKHCSEMERRAVTAEREAVKTKQASYMVRQIGSEYDGIISGVMNFGFFVRLTGPECEGLVRVSTLDDDYYHFDETNYLLIGRRTGKSFRMGDKIRVGVMQVDKEKREIDLFVVKSDTIIKKPYGRRALRNRKKKG